MFDVPTIRWVGDERGRAELIDQTLLPAECVILEVRTQEVMWDAIKRLAVRGAPAIGVAGAFGVVLGAAASRAATPEAFAKDVLRSADYLASSRPTAVNLFWAIDRMKAAQRRVTTRPASEQLRALHEEAQRIFAEDQAVCRALGRHGAALIEDGDTLLTHCNAGALATAGIGTALAVMFTAMNDGKRFTVYADETRPLLQGSRLTAWELMRSGIDVTVICDNAAAHVMRTRGVSRIFVGADRIAANGDTANKIGTYGLAVAAKAHGVPFYVVAPKSTFDLSIPDGSHIPIEEREAAEITEGFGKRTAPVGVKTFSPAFDVTPAALIGGIVTEYGVVSPVNAQRIQEVLRAS